MVRHLPATFVLMGVLGLIVGVATWAVRPSTFALQLAAIVAVPAALCGAAGGIVSVVMGAPEPTRDSNQLLPPEVAGMRIFFRSALPIVIAVLGCVSVVVAHHAEQQVADGQPGSPLGAAATCAILALGIAGGVATYVRYRDAAKAWWHNAMKESMQAQKERQAATQR
jgi:hypothetical protein